MGTEITIYPPFPFEITHNREEIKSWLAAHGLTYMGLSRTTNSFDPIVLKVEETRIDNKEEIRTNAIITKEKVEFYESGRAAEKLAMSQAGMDPVKNNPKTFGVIDYVFLGVSVLTVVLSFIF